MTSSKQTEHEYNSLQAEYIRHLSTLSTGSILLITIFLEKVFPRPRWKAFIAIALLGFLASVIGSIVTYSVLVAFPEDEPPELVSKTATWGLGVMWVGFLCGVLALAIFALKNLFVQQ